MKAVKPLSQTASARWKRRNRAHVKEKLEAWLSRNSDHRSRWKVAYQEKHKERQRVYDAERYLRPENVAKRLQKREAKKAYMRAWGIKNPHYGSVANARRQALKRSNGVGNQRIIRAWIFSWKSKASVACFWCKKQFPPSECHSDHIIPLKKNGVHSIENLCISCVKCNRSKHDRSLERWNQFLIEPVLL